MSDGAIIIDTRIDQSGAERGITSLGSMASKGLGIATKAAAVMATGITAATGAVVALTKASVEQYAEYEQLTGGVETLFKDSASQVMEYANVAYKTAGLSANDYMNTITGFSASLLQGLGGDTKKAAEIGNQAVIDMSDNANKMGTSMESIQNAYQGFAKQNYTMLDNLKLGYGGTKSEMERLLADAEKISGVHYDLSNFSDVISAIHVIQEQMGITGTTTKEAMTTIEGSLNMTKAAWTNMLTGMADDNADFDTLVDNLVESVSALGENLLPRIGIALNGVGQLIDTLLPVIIDKIPEMIENGLPGVLESSTNIMSGIGQAIMESSPVITELGVNVIETLVQGLTEAMPSIASTGTEVITILLSGLLETAPMFLDAGLQAIGYLAQGLGEQLPELLPVAVECVKQLVQTIIDNAPLILDGALALIQGLADGIINSIPTLIEALPGIIQGILDFFSSGAGELLEVGGEIILQLANGIIEAIPQIVDALPQIIDSIITFFTSNMATIVKTGIQVLLALLQGWIQALPQLISYLPQIINSIVNAVVSNLPQIIQAGVQIIVALASGLIQAIPQIIAAIPQIVSAIFNGFRGTNWGEIGMNIITGIGSGISSAAGALYNKACEIANNIKDKIKAALDIHSPSRIMRDQVGKMIIAGISVGMQQETTGLLNTARNICDQLINTFSNGLSKDVAANYINSIKNIDGTFSKLYNDLSAAQENVNWANGLTLDDNKWYYDAKTRLEDVKYQLEELSDKISDTEDKSTKESLQKQQKALQKQQKSIQKEFDYYKEAAQEEINQRKESTKKQLAIEKEKQQKLVNLAKATTEAIKNQLTEQKNNAVDAIEKEIDALEAKYNKESDLIDANADKKKARIQSKIDKLDEEVEAENRLKEVQEANNNIAVLQAKMNNTASEADKKAYALKIKNAKSALEEKRKEWDRTDEKAALKEEQEEIEERANRKKERLKEEYEAKKENLEKEKKATEEYYSKLLETDSINAQTRYMLLKGSNDELINLLQSYNPYWQNAGQSLADSLINGLNSRKEGMYSAVSNLMSLRGDMEGYASGTSYNKISGLYNVDEKGFELSTGNNPVAYVSKGAGILNHMQSTDYINKIVSEKVKALGSKLQSAVMGEQYKMGQLAFAGVSNSYGGNIDNSNNYNAPLLHADNITVRNQDDIENLAREFYFYKQRKKK